MKLKANIESFVLVSLGILSAAMGIKGFLLSTKFIDGGVTGMSMLLAKTTGIPLSILIFLINFPFLILGYRQLGVIFAVKSALAIAALSFCLAFMYFPDVTHDKGLTSVFGGIFIGIGGGLAIRGGAVLDGTEIAGMLVSKKMQLFKSRDVILLFNLMIFASAVFFLGVEPALYSVITYLGASKMIDFVLNGIEQYTGITVVSSKGDEIRKAISKRGRGVTVYEGKSGYGKDGHINAPRDIVFTVATRLEIPSIKREILDIDPAAFIVQHSIEDTSGGLVKRTGIH
nr:YitT family protein [uncultured Mucilaginibacter sp.]